jgi:D-alanine-D-alanine ligase
MAMTQPHPITLRTEVRESDNDAVRSLVAATGLFRPNEVAVAVELVTERLQHGESSGYFFVFAEIENKVVGYICFGPIEVTLHSYDLYWIVVQPEQQGKKIGTQLLQAALAAVAARGGQQIYIETSGRDDYAATRAFYERAGCHQEALIRNFYAPGDDKCIYVLRL